MYTTVIKLRTLIEFNLLQTIMIYCMITCYLVNIVATRQERTVYRKNINAQQNLHWCNRSDARTCPDHDVYAVLERTVFTSGTTAFLSSVVSHTAMLDYNRLTPVL